MTVLPLLVAAFLHRDPVLVCAVYREAERRALDPIVVVALVECESEWRVYAKSETGDIGLMQINMAYHGRYYDTGEHIRKGCSILRGCVDRRGGIYFWGLSLYNAGRVSERGVRYARKVLKVAARIKRAVLNDNIRPVPIYPKVTQQDRLYGFEVLWAKRREAWERLISEVH